MYRRTTTLTLRLVETIESSEDDFTEDEHPSLPGMQVYDTTAEDVTETRGPGLAKCGAVASERKRVGSRK